MRREYIITMTMSDKKSHEQIMKETLDKLLEDALSLPHGPERDKAMKFMRNFSSVKDNLFGGN